VKNLTWQNPEQLFVAQELINKVKSKCCGIKGDKKTQLKSMNTLHSYLAYYLLAINAVAFIVYGIDKYKAKKAKWRIPETTLLLLAAIGGSIGAWAGMRLWHHKTMHKKFKYGIPIIIILQVALAVYLHTNNIV
jgi:uncharacterized membrane protein YsdA (DUF1294 family)